MIPIKMVSIKDCPHLNTTLVRIRNTAATVRVCLDCGQELK